MSCRHMGKWRNWSTILDLGIRWRLGGLQSRSSLSRIYRVQILASMLPTLSPLSKDTLNIYGASAATYVTESLKCPTIFREGLPYRISTEPVKWFMTICKSGFNTHQHVWKFWWKSPTPIYNNISERICETAGEVHSSPYIKLGSIIHRYIWNSNFSNNFQIEFQRNI
jgi:hypothetical protein